MDWQKEYTEGLQDLLGAENVLTDPAQLTAYENDGLGFHRYKPDCVVLPTHSDQIKQIIDFAKTRDFPYVMRGAGTSLSGGPVTPTGGLIIHGGRLNSILEVNVNDLYCVVEPGVVLNRLNTHLSEFGVFYPPDPSSGYACTLGGNVAENAGGIRCFKYGVTANYILGIEAVLTNGEIVRFGGPAGGLGTGNHMDWRSLMVGSEGMLAAFTKFWLRIKAKPQKVWTFLANYKNLQDAADAIVDMVHSPIMPVALEFGDKEIVSLVENSPMAVGLDPDSFFLLSEIDGPAALVDAQANDVEAVLKKHGAKTVRRTDDEKERLKLWRARKVAGGLMGQLSPDLMIQDAVIPRQYLGELLTFLYERGEELNIPVLNIFHAGDGNLHPNFLFDGRVEGELERVQKFGRELMKKVVEYGGTLSGEHGIGNDKADYIPLIFTAPEVKAHKTILECFNANNQLNPEKVLPMRSFVGCCAPMNKS